MHLSGGAGTTVARDLVAKPNLKTIARSATRPSCTPPLSCYMYAYTRVDRNGTPRPRPAPAGGA